MQKGIPSSISYEKHLTQTHCNILKTLNHGGERDSLPDLLIDYIKTIRIMNPNHGMLSFIDQIEENKHV